MLYNKKLFAAIFCLISNVACSMEKNFDAIEINLDTASREQLLKLSVKSILKRNPDYCAKNIEVELTGFYLLKDQFQNTENPRYVVSLIGYYKNLDINKGRAVLHTIPKNITAIYWKHEFDALGFNVPEDIK